MSEIAIKPESYYTDLAIVSPNSPEFENKIDNLACILRSKTCRNIIAFVSRLFCCIPYFIAKCRLNRFNTSQSPARNIEISTATTATTPPLLEVRATNPTLLDTLKQYQNGTPQYSSFDVAMTEIRNGKKTSHWIWYVFPQHHGISGEIGIPSSSMNNECCMRNTADVGNFLRDDQLRKNYLDSCESIVIALKNTPSKSLRSIFGRDHTKVASSLTLLYRICKARGKHSPLCAIIDTIQRETGFKWCLTTDKLLQREADEAWAARKPTS